MTKITVEEYPSKVNFQSCVGFAQSKLDKSHNDGLSGLPLIEATFADDGLDKVTINSTISQVELWYSMSIYMCWMYNIPVDVDHTIKKKTDKNPMLNDVYHIVGKPAYHDKQMTNVLRLDIDHLYPTIIYHSSIRFDKLSGPFDIYHLFRLVYHEMLVAKANGNMPGPVMRAWINMTYGILRTYKFYDIDPMIFINTCKLLVRNAMYDELDMNNIYFDTDSLWYWYKNDGCKEAATTILGNRVKKLRDELLPTISYKIKYLDTFIYLRKKKYIEISSNGFNIKGFPKMKHNI